MVRGQLRKGNLEESLLVTFSVEGIPIGDAAIEHAHVDVIEVIRCIHPGATAVVNFKLEIGREVIVLNAGKVGALNICLSRFILYEELNPSLTDHMGIWKLFCEVSSKRSATSWTICEKKVASLCPQAIPCTDVEHILWIL